MADTGVPPEVLDLLRDATIRYSQVWEDDALLVEALLLRLHFLALGLLQLLPALHVEALLGRGHLALGLLQLLPALRVEALLLCLHFLALGLLQLLFPLLEMI